MSVLIVPRINLKVLDEVADETTVQIPNANQSDA